VVRMAGEVMIENPEQKRAEVDIYKHIAYTIWNYLPSSSRLSSVGWTF
jgi:hypothetical protein